MIELNWIVVREGPFDAQIERILNSETLRNSEALRRLLRYLADMSLSGEADQLKEYTVGIDALGKPATYDPRHDSVVRIQVGRLRQKLGEYYRSEGKDEPILIDLPKGGYRFRWEPRPQAAEASIIGPGRDGVRAAFILVSVAFIAAVVWAAFASVQLWRERRVSAPFHAAWTPELQELWRPFLETRRPLIVAVAAPLFVGFQGEGYYRDLSMNDWNHVLKSSKIDALRKTLGNAPLIPRYNYTGIGVMTAAFQLGKLLSVADASIAVTKSNQLSWQQFADNNVLLIGAPRVFGGQLDGLPVRLPLELKQGGVRVLDPRPGEPAFLHDAFPSIVEREVSSTPDDGEAYALITHAPGPLGAGDVGSFSSNRSPGTAAAAQSFTNPAWARTLVTKLRKSSGELPRYYQIVLKVRYKDTVPTEITYVMHRELSVAQQPSANRE